MLLLLPAVPAFLLITVWLCSVTKWMHLHGGDEAVRRLFSEVSRVLVPGGIFVLEPQPWKSYKAALQKLVRMHSWL